ncbi:hypothetical protein IWZ01DRAFT_485417 [Phyllosticta capitalensis]
MDSDLAESRSPDAIHEEQSTAPRAQSPHSLHPTQTTPQGGFVNNTAMNTSVSHHHVASTLSLLESLPTELVGLIGNHLESSDLRRLRTMSKSMNSHLTFSLKALFKTIRCSIPDMDRVLKFSCDPLAKAVESLIWVKPRETAQNQRLGSFPAAVFNAQTIEGLQTLAKSFPNLRSAGLIADLQEEGDMWTQHLSNYDLHWWARVVQPIKPSMEWRVYERQSVYWGVSWPGSCDSPIHSFVRTTLPFETLAEFQNSWDIEGGQTPELCASRISIMCTPIGDGLRSLQLHQTVMHAEALRLFAVEELVISECTILCGRFGSLTNIVFRIEADVDDEELRNFSQTIRKLRLFRCSMDVRDRSEIVVLFNQLSDSTLLEELQFEQVGDWTFDWDGNGSTDFGG